MRHRGTYQTRVSYYGGVESAAGDAALSACGESYGRVQRKLFADVAASSSMASPNSAYLKRHGIPARMFNAIRVSLDGKVTSAREQQKLRLDSLGRRMARAERQIAEAAGPWPQASGTPEEAVSRQTAVPVGWVEGPH